MPLAEKYYENCLSLPMFPALTSEEQSFVIKTIDEFIDQIEKLYAMNIVAPSEQQFFDRALEKYHSITTADSDIKKDFEKHIVQNETQHHPDQAGKFEQLWPELAHLCK